MSDQITLSSARVTKQGVELKTSRAGKQFATFSVMNSSRVRDSQGEWGYGPTEFYRVLVTGFNAEKVADQVGAGDNVRVSGEYKYSAYTTKDGDERESREITFAEVSIPLKKSDGGSRGGGSFDQNQSDPFGGAEDAPF